MTSQEQFAADLLSLTVLLFKLGIVLAICAGLSDWWVARQPKRKATYHTCDGKRESIFHSRQAE